MIMNVNVLFVIFMNKFIVLFMLFGIDFMIIMIVMSLNMKKRIIGML